MWNRKWQVTKKLCSKWCHSFGPIAITNDLLLRVNSKGIINPTEIQQKALKPVLDGKDIIINSETGSGKTLCYLLPIIMNLQKKKRYFQAKLISTPRAVIFAPTTELLHQIGCVCKDLGAKEVHVANDRRPLCINEETQFIITTPRYLMNYDWQRIQNVKHIVFDEADLMFVSQFKEVRKLFEFYTGRKIDFSRKEAIRRKKRESKQGYAFRKYEENPQFIFAGATMPTGGRKTILSLIDRFVPGAEIIQTEMVHKTVKNTRFDFIDLDEDFDTKTSVLAAILEQELGISGCHLNTGALLQGDAYNPFRVIVYVNKVADAESLFNALNKGKPGAHRDGQKSNQLNIDPNDTKSTDNEQFDFQQFVAKWNKNICFLRSDLSASERISIFERFSKGFYNVMITTGLAGRGIDIPNVNLVAQFDFPLNVADILHRAGRTGRAGAEGKVISFVTQKNKDLFQLFRAAIDNDKDVTHLFSRKRRLRRRIKEGKFVEKESLV